MLAQWQAWLNILVLVAIGVERWTRRHDVNAALVAHDLQEMKKSIESLHSKASDYATSQQDLVGRVSIDIAVLKSEVIALKQDVEMLRGGGQPSHSRRT